MSCWTKLRGSVGKMLKGGWGGGMFGFSCGGWLRCFLSYVISRFIANDVVVCRDFDDVDGFAGRDVCNGFQNA